MNSRFNDGDSWIIRRVEEPEIDESTWEDDEESLIEEVDSELAAMSDEDFATMRDAMGDIPFETRLALILLFAAASDGEVDDDELTGIVTVLERVHEGLGIALDAEKVLRKASKRIEKQDDAFEESVAVFAEYVPARVLASIVSAVQDIVGVDTEEEETVLAMLVEAWQVDPQGENDGEGEEEEEEGEEEEEEEDGEEEDEDDEDDGEEEDGEEEADDEDDEEEDDGLGLPSDELD
jgi:hypothetical protein